MKLIYSTFLEAKAHIAELLPIDYFFAKELIDTLSIEQDVDLCFHLFLALNISLRAGHTCLPLYEIATTKLGYQSDDDGNEVTSGYNFPDLTSLTQFVSQLKLDSQSLKPVVYWKGNLYLRRYFKFEQDLSIIIRDKLALKSEIDIALTNTILSHLFPEHFKGLLDKEVDWQFVAVANALNKQFAVIAGGPGTGKTYTVTKLLAAKIMLEENNDSSTLTEKPFNIALVAPTGKAAQRLSESIANAITGFQSDIDSDILQQIPTSAQTIHRLLGVIHNQPHFKHNEHNLLPYDLVLVDEVSMVDLPLMLRLLKALKPECSVVLLGDADQLPSVSTGSVLADIAPKASLTYSRENIDYLTRATAYLACDLSSDTSSQHCQPLDYLSFLKKSRRFDGTGGIGLLANAVINGNEGDSWKLLTQENHRELNYVDASLIDWLIPLVNKYYLPLAQTTNIEQGFELLSKFRVLCATKSGEIGVEALNNLITYYVKSSLDKQYLPNDFDKRFLPTDNLPLYHGQPIMITENNYQLGLYNGDIGLVWRSENGKLLVYFEDTQFSTGQGLQFRKFIPTRLPHYDSVYAMTIHKTQGSEFEHVAMVLPTHNPLGDANKLLSRELLYTAITRAKKQLTISSDLKTWQAGVRKKVNRFSGLRLN
ncbi:exodeoxyribonuclease V subunit alpha [Litorilituus lipolyticus]|uniref:RecBCD enzyme subunit RecD n=1 Tax=Litorilituus lipolyticus TaxID=2491017 RepID=A0A502KT61_9GAMM|nr:exodeoxyribonuclease V subunit alpha [Litorilituus lipolyticus]TPH12833.1 exodeoxyribonuclease V subunit alpha [Litorilituus lipolyticus]